MRAVVELANRWVRVTGQGQTVLWCALGLLAALAALVAGMQRPTAMSAPIAEAEAMTVEQSIAPSEFMALTNEQKAVLAEQNWAARVGERLGVWVSVREQRFRLIQGEQVVWDIPCSTAAKGVGSKINSFQTPLGWHSVAEKIGEGKPAGQVYREKRPTNEIWKPGDVVKEDLVLTRVLTLRGEEPGRNRDGDVDSFARGIYIHGTNDEARIGQPTSHGCVRLTNADVIVAFERIPQGTMVLITE